MASISGASSSNMTSSLYNSANVVSGLASGLDTEGMIESLVQSYQTKINQLNQKVTKIEWKQEDYRSIISKMVGFSNKYTSYASPTNLLSASFFNNAVKVAAQGLYANKVTASGKTSSNVALNAVHQLATSTQYRTSGNLKAGDGKSVQASKGFDLNGKTTLSSLNGSLTLTYGSNNITLNFNEVTDKEALEAIKEKYSNQHGQSMSESQALAELINQKLEGQTITFSGGSAADAKDRIEVRVDGMNITFKDKTSAGNAVYMSKATGNVAKTLGIEEALKNASEDKPSTIGLTYDFSTTRQEDNASYLSEKTLNMSLDGGTAKQVTLPEIVTRNGKSMIWDTEENKAIEYNAENYTKVLNDTLYKVYKGKVKAENLATDGTLQLSIIPQEGSNLLINTEVGETLGIGRIATSYLNTSKTLGDLVDLDDSYALRYSDGSFALDEKGNKQYRFVLNNTIIGTYTKDSTLSEVINDINSNKGAGVKVSYSQTTNNFLFSASETGSDGDITMGFGLAQVMFGQADSYQFSTNEKVGNLLGTGADYGESGDNATIHFGDNMHLPLRIEAEDSVSDVVQKLNDLIDEIQADVGVANFDYTARFDKTLGTFVLRDNATGEDLAASSGEGVVESLLSAVAASVERSKNSAIDLSGSTKALLGMGTDQNLAGNIFSVNVGGKQVEFTFGLEEDSKLEHILSNIENILGDGSKAAFSGKDGSLIVTDKNGRELTVSYNDKENNLAETIVNKLGEQLGYTKGLDAKFTVTVNGEQIEMTRGSNSIVIDGLTINMQDTFDSAEVDANGNPVLGLDGKPVYKASNAVTFKSSTDSDKIIDAIKSMIEDYNVMMAEVKAAYSTMPYQNSNGKFANYEPLTDDEKAGMTESAIERYEEKARQGILFGDRTLSTMYEKMRNIFSPNGEDGAYLRAMGITTSYTISDGSEAVTLDEDKLRAMLDSDPDLVADVFTRVGGENGGGVMQNLKVQLDAYAKTTGEPKGILIQQAGSPLSSLSLMNNTWQSQLDNINTQIEKWQDKLSDQVDRYTQQFSRLEVLIQQMNSQSSTLAGLMGGY